MKLLSILLENFGSYYGEHVFRVQDRGLTLVRGDNQDELRMDSNGAGKSTIFDALDWCWFGESPRGSHADSMFNEEAYAERGSQCRVVTTMLNDKGESVLIERIRTKSKNSLRVLVADKDLSTLDTRETQQNLEMILGLDRATFHAAVLFAQGDLVHYADSTDSERMRILTRILQLDKIDEYLENTKFKLKAVTQGIDRTTNQRTAVEAELQTLKGIDYRADFERWENGRKQQEEQLEQEITSLKSELEHLTKETENLEQQMLRKSELDKRQNDVLFVVPDFLQKELDNANEVLNRCHNALAVAKANTDRLVGEIEQYTNMQEGVCSTCGQSVTKDHLETEILKRQHEIRVVEDEAKIISSGLVEWHDQKVKIDGMIKAQGASFLAAKQQLTGEILDLAMSIGHKQSQWERMQAAKGDLERKEKEQQKIADQINPFVEKIKTHEIQLKEKQTIFEKLEVQKEKLELRWQYLDFWVKAFSPNGLKSYILDSRLSELTDAANQWVQLLTGGTIWVRFESQKKKRSGDLKNAPDLRVFRWNPDGSVAERPYKNWSGGEKQRISFAVDFGLTRLIAQRAEQSYNFLGLDEVFKHLDRAGKEAIIEMLQQLAREKESVLVVEHDNEFQSYFENVVTAVKKHKRSVLKEAINGRTTIERQTEKQSLPISTFGKPKPIRTPVPRPVASD